MAEERVADEVIEIYMWCIYICAMLPTKGEVKLIKHCRAVKSIASGNWAGLPEKKYSKLMWIIYSLLCLKS